MLGIFKARRNRELPVLESGKTSGKRYVYGLVLSYPNLFKIADVPLGELTVEQYLELLLHAVPIAYNAAWD